MIATIEFDVPRALDRVGGDRILLARIIDFVVEDSPDLVRKIETSLENDQFGEVERAAHSLKGLVANVYCDAVQSRAVEIETLARSGDRPAILRALETLSDLMEPMVAKLEVARRELEDG
ncbi:MAG TPA: Hpt domain-containing protein [Planctomycetaceae bacterium]|jgi:HPt (histidine-containing phosphotransfer) domain-containing protein|nr:Hpt domain-containing protein [Planctomycetaceae bacterium]